MKGILKSTYMHSLIEYVWECNVAADAERVIVEMVQWRKYTHIKLTATTVAFRYACASLFVVFFPSGLGVCGQWTALSMTPWKFRLSKWKSLLL